MSDADSCEMFAMFDPEGELISVFPARDLAQAVQIKIAMQADHQKQHGCDCIFSVARASRNERRYAKSHFKDHVVVRLPRDH
jgi:hypothetical protein